MRTQHLQSLLPTSGCRPALAAKMIGHCFRLRLPPMCKLWQDKGFVMPDHKARKRDLQNQPSPCPRTVMPTWLKDPLIKKRRKSATPPGSRSEPGYVPREAAIELIRRSLRSGLYPAANLLIASLGNWPAADQMADELLRNSEELSCEDPAQLYELLRYVGALEPQAGAHERLSNATEADLARQNLRPVRANAERRVQYGCVRRSARR
jgi:hypothetical protein